jgi:hypothetical protein
MISLRNSENWHVVEYYRFLCRYHAWRGDFFRQWWYYSQAELEANPNWKST